MIYNGIEITIPESITDLSLEQYTKVVKLTSELREETIDSNRFLITLSIIETVCGLTEEELDGFTIEEVNDLAINVAEKIKTYKIN